MSDTILYLSSNHVQLACQHLDSSEVMREVFRLHGSKETLLPDEAYLTWTIRNEESARSLNMPGYVGGRIDAVGTKIINSNINNPKRGIPRANGITLLYDTASGCILCIMEGAYLSSLRTASVTALSVEYLAGRKIECMALIGTGALARAHINVLMDRLNDLKKISVYDVDPERAKVLQRDIQPQLEKRGISLSLTSSAEEAIRTAQLIIPVTTTTTGYIDYNWLMPGALLVNVSLDDPKPDVVLKSDRLIVDDWSLIKSDTRRLFGRMYRNCSLVGPGEAEDHVGSTPRCISAELGDIVTGRTAGRLHQDDIILVNPFGMAIEDIALASTVYGIARDRNLGMYLPV